MKELYITITGFKHYYDKAPLKVGNLIRCSKEPDNAVDSEAIRCFLPMIGTVGYVANSSGTVAGGTYSAGRVYDQVPDRFYVRVCFTTCTKVICKVELEQPVRVLNEELERQTESRKSGTTDRATAPQIFVDIPL